MIIINIGEDLYKHYIQKEKEMITFPIKTNKKGAAVSPLFGKAKFFAFYDGVNITIEENTNKSGSGIIDWFIQKGVTDIIIKEIGSNPYKKIQETNMNIYFVGDHRITIEEVIDLYEKKSLNKLDEEKILEIIKKHNSHSHT